MQQNKTTITLSSVLVYNEPKTVECLERVSSQRICPKTTHWQNLLRQTDRASISLAQQSQITSPPLTSYMKHTNTYQATLLTKK